MGLLQSWISHAGFDLNVDETGVHDTDDAAELLEDLFGIRERGWDMLCKLKQLPKPGPLLRNELVRYVVSRLPDINRAVGAIIGVKCTTLCHAKVNASDVEVMLQHGADVCSCDPVDLHLPLHAHCSEATVRLLLAAPGGSGVVNARDAMGRTPLHYPKDAGAVRALLEHGADPNARETDPDTSSWMWECFPCQELLSEWPPSAAELVATATAHRAGELSDGLHRIELWADNSAGRTPLHYAAQRYDAEAVGALLAAGADPGVRDAQGLTPIEYADAYNTDELIDILMRTCRVAFRPNYTEFCKEQHDARRATVRGMLEQQ